MDYDVVLNAEQLELTIGAIRTAIASIDEWNMGDEYDVDLTPLIELLSFYQTYLEE